MTTINLLPWRAKKQRNQKKQFLSLCVFSACIALIFNGIWYAIIQSKLNYFDKRYNILQQAINTAQIILSRKNKVTEEEEKTLSQLHTIAEFNNQRYRIVTLLTRLAKLLPGGIIVNEIDVQKNKTSIKGEATTEIQISELVDQFNKQSDWRDVKLEEIANKLAATKKITFHITFSME